MKTKKQLKEEQREEEIEQKYENIIECLLILATKDKKIVTMTQFLEILKENYNLKFDIRGSKYNGIYHFLGDISQEFIDENIPNITTIIDFKNELKPFYRLIDTSHIDDFEEEKKFLKKYPNGEEILKNERKKIFEFDWKNWFEILESNEKENEKKIANKINFDLNQEIKLSDIKDKE